VLEKIRELWNERLRPIITPALAALIARYKKLEPREKLLVRIAAVIVALLLGYNLVYVPVINLSYGLHDRIDARQRELVEVRRLVQRYQRLKLDLAATEKRTVPTAKDFSLFSVLEQALSKSVAREKIGSITPVEKRVSNQLTEHSVELKLSSVSLGQIVDVLYSLKSLTVPITVSNLHIRRGAQDPHSYDVDMTCITLTRNG
jgi:type II secretory pathway component PulM